MVTLESTPIAELILAMRPTGRTKEAEPGTGIIVPELSVDNEMRTNALAILGTLDVTTAGTLIDLGCTGLTARGARVDQIRDVRSALEGSGLGLPCFVGTDRFCLAHGGIGGLQDGQQQRYVESLPSMSRALEPRERAHVEMIESARRMEGGKRAAVDALSGKRVSDGFLQDVTQGLEQPGEAPAVVDVPPTPAAVARAEDAFKCPEHGKTYWNCRYCVAAEIVNGPFEPTYVVDSDPGTLVKVAYVKASELDTKLSDLDDAGAVSVHVYVRVAEYRHKLARD